MKKPKEPHDCIKTLIREDRAFHIGRGLGMAFVDDLHGLEVENKSDFDIVILVVAVQNDDRYA